MIGKGAHATVKMKLSTAAWAAIKRALRAGKRVSVTLKISAADSAGNTTSLGRTIKLKR